MNKVEQLIRDYLKNANVMQLATSVNDQPWVCTVHFYADDSLNLYWASTEARRHSQEIKQNPKAGASVLVHENTPDENYVIGISIAGQVECIGHAIDDDIAAAYIGKHHKDAHFLDDIRSGKNPHQFYRLQPSQIVLFDSKEFRENPRQEWTPDRDPEGPMVS